MDVQTQRAFGVAILAAVSWGLADAIHRWAAESPAGITPNQAGFLSGISVISGLVLAGALVVAGVRLVRAPSV